MGSAVFKKVEIADYRALMALYSGLKKEMISVVLTEL